MNPDGGFSPAIVSAPEEAVNKKYTATEIASWVRRRASEVRSR
jgi:hypothetical protein